MSSSWRSGYSVRISFTVILLATRLTINDTEIRIPRDACLTTQNIGVKRDPIKSEHQSLQRQYKRFPMDAGSFVLCAQTIPSRQRSVVAPGQLRNCGPSMSRPVVSRSG